MALLTISVTFLAASSRAQDQAADTTFLNRNIRQQVFLIGYLQENAKEIAPATEREIASFISGAEEAWAAEASGEDPLVQRLNPYVAMWLLHTAYARTNSDLPAALECFNYAKHVVPAFLADIDRYRIVDTAHAALIRWGYDWAGGSLALRCDIGAEGWSALEAAFEEAPTIVQRYLDAAAYPNERIRSQIEEAQRFFSRRRPLYAVRGALYRRELDTAFAGLAAATTQGFDADDIRPLGEALWRSYLHSDEISFALAALDLLARTLTAGDLPRDTLRAWYLTTNPEGGADRFDLMTASKLPALVASGKRVELTGTYSDLLTGSAVDLSDLAGRLVLIDFWATWCAPCIAEIPELRSLVAEYGDTVRFISVNADAVTGAEGPDGVRIFIEKHGVDYPVLYDDPEHSLAARFGVNGYPSKFLVSPQGVLLVHPSDGQRTVSLNDVESYLEDRR